MHLDEVYLRRENELFVFDRRQKRLFRIENGRRREETDAAVVAMIVTGPAKVLVREPAGLRAQPGWNGGVLPGR
jgi:hypothetical protein